MFSRAQSDSMVFSSNLFLFLFLPAFLSVYFLLPGRRLRNLALLGFSFLFYFLGEPSLFWVLPLSATIDYLAGRHIAEARRSARPAASQERQARIALICSLAGNLGLLGYYKYFVFFATSVESTFGVDLWTGSLSIFLPIGISFYTFQSMSYTIDVYRGRVQASASYLNFLAYVSAFPQLVAGPIVRYSEVADQLSGRRESVSMFQEGIHRFIIGLAKKAILANTLAVTADAIFALPTAELTVEVAWLGALTYMGQLYFDFSGYSDMAIGIGCMLGFRYPENFNYPYCARSIRDFWRRWHISLSSWFRDYLYIPMGGNRGSAAIVFRNLIVVFALCGLWHGAAWNFVVWGLFHGFFLVLERTRFSALLDRVPRAAQHVYTMGVVLVGWVVFRSESLEQAVGFLRAMFDLSAFSSRDLPISMFIEPAGWLALGVGMVASTPLAGCALAALSTPSSRRVKQYATALSGARWVWSYALGLVSASVIASGSYNPFIYFRF